MNNEPIFINIWRRYEGFEFAEPTVPYCQFAEAFSNWAESALHIGSNASLVQLNQSKILLIDRYFDFFSIVPKDHRYYFNPKSHICIYQVFMEYYRRIRTRELSISPPRIYEPLPPPPPPPPRPPVVFEGIVFAEDED